MCITLNAGSPNFPNAAPSTRLILARIGIEVGEGLPDSLSLQSPCRCVTQRACRPTVMSHGKLALPRDGFGTGVSLIKLRLPR